MKTRSKKSPVRLMALRSLLVMLAWTGIPLWAEETAAPATLSPSNAAASRPSGFVDANGDSLNAGFADKSSGGDQRNDITGLRYQRSNLRGYRYGFINEERGFTYRRFIDANNDGMHDRAGRFPPPFLGNKDKMDYFIDEDGDGIGDGRRLGTLSPPVWHKRGQPRPAGRSPRQLKLAPRR